MGALGSEVDSLIELPLELMGQSKAERAHRSIEMLELVKLSELTHRKPRQISGGQSQRVALGYRLLRLQRSLRQQSLFAQIPLAPKVQYSTARLKAG